MTRYQKELYKNYTLTFFSVIAGTLACAFMTALIGGGAYSLIATFEMFVIIMFQLEPGLIISEIAKWGIGSAACALVLITTIGLTIGGIVESKQQARKKIDDENKEILDALQGNTL